LLLGHASGDDGDIAGVAPWPELEGSALDALDALIRLLRVLARHQRVLGEAMPPAQWRERLLGLLDALLPQPPPAPVDQRTLERLRTLIDQFAADARRAGFDAAVPAEVLRAHVAASLGEADTRAPLLTGGVSFARMVPMRLLPFRAICVLGMNDGDYPRRDPGAGLNQLTAELGTSRRRAGDRSLRDDDRFLFLQLFAAAADVFYLSYLGADPRDGSAREPSVLVSELLDVAAGYHADADGARKALVVAHPLQPFAPGAFGATEEGVDDEPRRFSYCAQWHPAAAAVHGVRVEPARWLQSPLPIAAPVDALPLGTLSLGELSAFLRDPPAAFLRQRLALRLPQAGDAIDDCEPLAAPPRGLQLQQLQQAVFDACARGDMASLHARLRAQALLPSGPLGERELATLRTQLQPYAEAFTHWRGDDRAGSRAFELDLGGARLHGRIGDLYRKGLARFRFDPLHGPSQISHGLDWLVLCALGEDIPLAQFVGTTEPLPLRREPVGADVAQAALRTLLALRQQGLREPLPFGARAGWAWFAAVNDHGDNDDKGWSAASKQWRSDHGWSEGATASAQLALRGRDPFVDPMLGQRFRAIARTVFDAVVHGRNTPDALDAASLDAIAELSA
jgi:exodeoxyribonuclease V gamma subunit